MKLCMFDFMTLVSECDRNIWEAVIDRRLTKNHKQSINYCYSLHERIYIWICGYGWYIAMVDTGSNELVYL